MRFWSCSLGPPAAWGARLTASFASCSFPVFENPYPMDVHESPVTCTAYFADCPPDIIPILYSIGAKHKKTGYSQKVGGEEERKTSQNRKQFCCVNTVRLTLSGVARQRRNVDFRLPHLPRNHHHRVRVWNTDSKKKIFKTIKQPQGALEPVTEGKWSYSKVVSTDTDLYF